jgi:hypothetical protein
MQGSSPQTWRLLAPHAPTRDSQFFHDLHPSGAARLAGRELEGGAGCRTAAREELAELELEETRDANQRNRPRQGYEHRRHRRSTANWARKGRKAGRPRASPRL